MVVGGPQCRQRGCVVTAERYYARSRVIARIGAPGGNDLRFDRSELRLLQERSWFASGICLPCELCLVASMPPCCPAQPVRTNNCRTIDTYQERQWSISTVDDLGPVEQDVLPCTKSADASGIRTYINTTSKAQASIVKPSYVLSIYRHRFRRLHTAHQATQEPALKRGCCSAQYLGITHRATFAVASTTMQPVHKKQQFPTDPYICSMQLLVQYAWSPVVYHPGRSGLPALQSRPTQSLELSKSKSLSPMFGRSRHAPLLSYHRGSR
jgi:hypothetical protein